MSRLAAGPIARPRRASSPAILRANDADCAER
jgi:hypothetical protein